jgi:FkbM family methyltransferase
MSEPDAKLYQTVHGPMLAFRGDRYVTRSLEHYGEFSGLEQRLFENIVQSGMTVVEVGANIGAHTVPLARACAPGPLYAFEPQQRVFQLLCANLALNDIRNAVALPEALGAEPGRATMPALDYGAEGNFGGVSVTPAEQAAPGLPVRVAPLDSFDLPACHFLKIDVEGFEPEVLKGAAETIGRCRPILYVENDRAENQGEVIALIDRLGYRQYWHVPPLFDAANPNGKAENLFGAAVSLNLFCLPKESPRQVKGLEQIDPANWTSPVTPASRVAVPPPSPRPVQAPEVSAAFGDMARGDYGSAERRLAQAVAADPSDHHAMHAYGALLSTLGRPVEAEAVLRRALALRPQNPDTRTALAIALLGLGRFEEGWELYESRHDRGGANRKPPIPCPEWKGEPLAGKVLHIWPDEGFGDQIQFVRLVPALQAQGAEAHVICAPPLARLFAQSLEAAVYPAQGDVDLPDPDYWVMFGALLARTGATAETAPRPPYLKARQARAPKGARIGVVASGNPNHPNNLHRSLPADLAAELLAIPGAISLDPAATGAKDFADTADIVAGLDLVISVDTSVAHLAGAMGKPVWILIPALGVDWRWGFEGETTAWYPSARLWRQPAIGQWRPVVDAVVRAAATMSS